jgi:hypothetical protein
VPPDLDHDLQRRPGRALSAAPFDGPLIVIAEWAISRDLASLIGIG